MQRCNKACRRRYMSAGSGLDKGPGGRGDKRKNSDSQMTRALSPHHRTVSLLPKARRALMALSPNAQNSRRQFSKMRTSSDLPARRALSHGAWPQARRVALSTAQVPTARHRLAPAVNLWGGPYGAALIRLAIWASPKATKRPCPAEHDRYVRAHQC